MNTESWISRAQALGGKAARCPASWVWRGVWGGAGSHLPVSPVGERKLGDRLAESLEGKECQLQLSLGNCGKLSRALAGASLRI